nr:extensin-like [Camelus dromedarius]
MDTAPQLTSEPPRRPTGTPGDSNPTGLLTQTPMGHTDASRCPSTPSLAPPTNDPPPPTNIYRARHSAPVLSGPFLASRLLLPKDPPSHPPPYTHCSLQTLRPSEPPLQVSPRRTALLRLSSWRPRASALPPTAALSPRSPNSLPPPWLFFLPPVPSLETSLAKLPAAPPAIPPHSATQSAPHPEPSHNHTEANLRLFPSAPHYPCPHLSWNPPWRPTKPVAATPSLRPRRGPFLAPSCPQPATHDRPSSSAAIDPCTTPRITSPMHIPLS